MPGEPCSNALVATLKAISSFADLSVQSSNDTEPDMALLHLPRPDVMKEG